MVFRELAVRKPYDFLILALSLLFMPSTAPSDIRPLGGLHYFATLLVEEIGCSSGVDVIPEELEFFLQQTSQVYLTNLGTLSPAPWDFTH